MRKRSLPLATRCQSVTLQGVTDPLRWVAALEIERPDEADALVVDREQANDHSGAPPETRDQQTYREEYRATVEAAYTWDAAALELRQTWEAHEAKWPSPEDAHADGDRHLNPEANAEVERGWPDPRDRRKHHHTRDARPRVRRPGPPPDRPRTPPQRSGQPQGKDRGKLEARQGPSPEESA